MHDNYTSKGGCLVTYNNYTSEHRHLFHKKNKETKEVFFVKEKLLYDKQERSLFRQRLISGLISYSVKHSWVSF
jgi:hypothetical protein